MAQSKAGKNIRPVLAVLPLEDEDRRCDGFDNGRDDEMDDWDGISSAPPP
jgi:hypothetical protein